MSEKIYICECGREFTTSQGFNGHKGHCKIHLGDERYEKVNNSYYIGNEKGVNALRDYYKNRKQKVSIDCDIKHTCEKCGKGNDGTFGSGRFCSRKCANSRDCSEEKKKRVSEKLKGITFPGRKLSDEHKKNLSLANKGQVRSDEYVQKRKEYKKNISDEDRKTYSEKMSKILKGKTGGFRPGGGNGKKGRYKGYWCDSSWELAYVIYNLEHNIPFKRNKNKFPYEYEGVMHFYYPDFILEDGTYIEIKGYETERNLIKHSSCSNLIVLKKDELKEVFKYVGSKYGIDYIKLYEKR